MSLLDPEIADGPAPQYSAVDRLWRVFASPGAVFEDIGRRPTVLLGLIALTLFSVLTQVAIVPHVDMEATIRANLEAQGRETSDAEFDQALKAAEFFRWVGPVAALIFSPVFMVGLAGLFYVALKLGGSDADFMRTLSATLHAYWPPAVVGGVLYGAVAQTVGQIPAEEIQNMVKSHVAAFLSADAPKWLSAMLSSVDVFNIWTVILLILGLSIAGRVSRGRAAAGVLGIWGIYVLGKGLVAMAFAGLGAQS